MRLVHLTDMHAGRADSEVVEAMLDAIGEAAPDLVVVGGDLTQRSRTSQWRTAAEWLERMPCDWIATPGNHDIPLFDLPRRVVDPFGRFRRFVGHDLEPSASVGGAFVICARTASPRRRVEGALDRESLWLAREMLDGRSPHDPVVLVTHHPLVMHPSSGRERSLVVRADELLEVASSGGVDLLLSGHLHRPHGGEPFTVDLGGRQVLAMHGGTACSTRLRGGESPAWQMADLSPGRITLSSVAWDGRRYARASGSDWVRDESGGWERASRPLGQGAGGDGVGGPGAAVGQGG